MSHWQRASSFCRRENGRKADGEDLQLICFLTDAAQILNAGYTSRLSVAEAHAWWFNIIVIVQFDSVSWAASGKHNSNPWRNIFCQTCLTSISVYWLCTLVGNKLGFFCSSALMCSLHFPVIYFLLKDFPFASSIYDRLNTIINSFFVILQKQIKHLYTIWRKKSVLDIKKYLMFTCLHWIFGPCLLTVQHRRSFLLQLWLQLISSLCCSEGERASMCMRGGERRREEHRQHVHQRATCRTLGSHRSVPPPFLSLSFLLVLFFWT